MRDRPHLSLIVLRGRALLARLLCFVVCLCLEASSRRRGSLVLSPLLSLLLPPLSHPTHDSSPSPNNSDAHHSLSSRNPTAPLPTPATTQRAREVETGRRVDLSLLPSPPVFLRPATAQSAHVASAPYTRGGRRASGQLRARARKRWPGTSPAASCAKSAPSRSAPSSTRSWRSGRASCSSSARSSRRPRPRATSRAAARAVVVVAAAERVAAAAAGRAPGATAAAGAALASWAWTPSAATRGAGARRAGAGEDNETFLFESGARSSDTGRAAPPNSKRKSGAPRVDARCSAPPTPALCGGE